MLSRGLVFSAVLVSAVSFLLSNSQGDHLSGKPGNVREMSGILLQVSKVSGKNLVREKWTKTVYCSLHIWIHTGI